MTWTPTFSPVLLAAAQAKAERERKLRATALAASLHPKPAASPDDAALDDYLETGQETGFLGGKLQALRSGITGLAPAALRGAKMVDDLAEEHPLASAILNPVGVPLQLVDAATDGGARRKALTAELERDTSDAAAEQMPRDASFLERGLASLPTTAAIIGAGAAAGPVAALGTGIGMETSSIYDKIRREGTIGGERTSVDRAFASALPMGVLSGSLEALGAKGISSAATGGGLSAAARRGLVAAGGEGGTELTQELIDMAGERMGGVDVAGELVGDESNTLRAAARFAARPLEAGAQGALVGGVLHAGHEAAGAGGRVRQAAGDVDVTDLQRGLSDRIFPQGRLEREALAGRLSQAEAEAERLRSTLVASDLAATVDPLTGAQNRRALARIQEQVDAAPNMKWVMADGNDISLANKIAGQAAGDQEILAIASAADQLGPGVQVFRTGGDEFALAVDEDVAGPAEEVAARWRGLFAPARDDYKIGDVPFQTSLGVSVGNTLREADQGLQAAKAKQKAELGEKNPALARARVELEAKKWGLPTPTWSVVSTNDQAGTARVRFPAAGEDGGTAEVVLPSSVAQDLEEARQSDEPGSRDSRDYKVLAEQLAADPKVAMMDVASLSLKPEKYQFRVQDTAKSGRWKGSNIDGAQAWHEDLAGVINVWRDPETGDIDVVNGHNRFLKARDFGVKRLAVKFIDAPNAKAAKQIGALINMAEDHGSVIDAARFLREKSAGPVDQVVVDAERAVAPSARLIAEGGAIARLQDDLYNAAINGQLPVAHAVAIGRYATSKNAQDAVQGAMEQNRRDKKAKPLTAHDIENMASRAQYLEDNGMGTGGAQQVGLFGAKDYASAAKNMIEEARLTSALLDSIGAGRVHLRNAARGAGAIGKVAGNRVDAEASAARADELGKVAELFEKFKHQGGVASAINEGARRVAAGESRDVVAAELEGRLPALLEAEFFGRVPSPAGAGQGLFGPLPAAEAEAGGMPAEAAAEDVDPNERPATAAELEAQGQGGLFGAPVIDQLRSKPGPEGSLPPEMDPQGQGGYIGERPPPPPQSAAERELDRFRADYIAGDEKREPLSLRKVVDGIRRRWYRGEDYLYRNLQDRYAQHLESAGLPAEEVKSAKKAMRDRLHQLVAMVRGSDVRAGRGIESGTTKAIITEDGRLDEVVTGEGLHDIIAGMPPKVLDDLEALMAALSHLDTVRQSRKQHATLEGLIAQRNATRAEVAQRARLAAVQDVAVEASRVAGDVAAAGVRSEYEPGLFPAPAKKTLAGAVVRQVVGDVMRPADDGVATMSELNSQIRSEIRRLRSRPDYKPLTADMLEGEQRAKAVARAISEKYGEERAAVMFSAAQRVTQVVNRQFLVPAVRLGLISAERAREFEGANPNYARLVKVMHETVADDVLGAEATEVRSAGGGSDSPMGMVRARKVGLRRNSPARGGDQRVVPPLRSVIEKLARMNQVADRLAVRNYVTDMADGAPDIVGPDIMPAQLAERKLGRKLKPQEKIVRWKDGNAVEYYASQGVKEALAFLEPSPKDANFALRVAALSSRLLRTGATDAPAFTVRNVFRDQFNLAWRTKYGAVPFLDWGLGAMDVIVGRSRSANPALAARLDGTVWANMGRAYAEAIQAGVVSSTNVMSVQQSPSSTVRTISARGMVKRALARHMARVGDSALPPAVAHMANVAALPLRGLEALSSFSEMASRVGALRNARLDLDGAAGGSKIPAALRKTYRRLIAAETKRATLLEAATEARDVTLDFRQAGADGKKLNMVVAFFNANMQDFGTTMAMVKERPWTSALRAAAFIGLPSVAMWARNKDDEDYRNRPEWEKALFWHLHKNEDGTWVKLPRPIGLMGFAMGRALEIALQAADGGGMTPELTDALRDGIEQSTPLGLLPTPGASRAQPGIPARIENVAGLIPDAARIPLEAAADYDPLTRQEIVPRSMDDVIPELQSFPSTPQFWRDVGERFQVSPIRVQHLFEAQFATLGRQAVTAGEQLAKGDNPAMAAIVDPVRNAFLTRGVWGFGTEPVRDFQAAVRQARAMKKSIDILEKSGRPQRAAELRDQHPEWAMSSYLDKQADRLAQLSKVQAMIASDKSLTEVEREQAKLQIDQMVSQTAITANDLLARLRAEAAKEGQR